MLAGKGAFLSRSALLGASQDLIDFGSLRIMINFRAEVFGELWGLVSRSGRLEVLVTE